MPLTEVRVASVLSVLNPLSGLPLPEYSAYLLPLRVYLDLVIVVTVGVADVVCFDIL